MCIHAAAHHARIRPLIHTNWLVPFDDDPESPLPAKAAKRPGQIVRSRREAGADYWSASTTVFFADAPYHHLHDPAERVLANLDLRAALKMDMAASLAQATVTDVDAASLALHVPAVVQGAFILAKAKGDAEITRDSSDAPETLFRNAVQKGG